LNRSAKNKFNSALQQQQQINKTVNKYEKDENMLKDWQNEVKYGENQQRNNNNNNTYVVNENKRIISSNSDDYDPITMYRQLRAQEILNNANKQKYTK
jgi:hypothetical protein